jgi:hypothetical protein
LPLASSANDLIALASLIISRIFLTKIAKEPRVCFGLIIIRSRM